MVWRTSINERAGLRENDCRWETAILPTAVRAAACEHRSWMQSREPAKLISRQSVSVKHSHWIPKWTQNRRRTWLAGRKRMKNIQESSEKLYITEPHTVSTHYFSPRIEILLTRREINRMIYRSFVRSIALDDQKTYVYRWISGQY